MLLKKLYVILLTMVALPIGINAGQKLTLRESISIALRQNSSLIKSSNNIGINIQALKTANAWFYPSFGLSGSFEWQHQIPKNGSGTENRSWSVSAGGDVTLFDGLSNYANVSQRENNLGAARMDLAKLKQDVILQTTSLFISILSNKKLMDFQKEELSYNKALLEKIKNMFEIKSVAITDVFSQEAQTANAELNYLQAENSFQKARVELLNFLSLDISQDTSFSFDSEELGDSSAVSGDFSSLFQSALQARKDYQSEMFKIKAAEAQLQISKSSYYPQVSGTYGLSTNANAFGELFDSRNYSLGLRFSMPVFSQFSTQTAVETAAIQLMNNNEDMRSLERQIKTDVKTTHIDMQTAKKQYEVALKAAQSAELSWKAKKESYALGAASYLDLQLSYNNYLQSQYNVISKEYGFIYSQFALMNALGKLE